MAIGIEKRFRRQKVQMWAAIPPLANVGTLGATTVSAEEYGDSINHTSVLTLASFAVGTSGDNASLGFGALLYTFPAGIIRVTDAAFVGLGITAAISVTTDTPEVGLGTVVATGAIATLGAGAATMENILEGGTPAIAGDVAGTVFNASRGSNLNAGGLIIPAASVHTVYLNVADGWADVTAAGAVTASGVVVINWQKLS